MNINLVKYLTILIFMLFRVNSSIAGAMVIDQDWHWNDERIPDTAYGKVCSQADKADRICSYNNDWGGEIFDLESSTIDGHTKARVKGNVWADDEIDDKSFAVGYMFFEFDFTLNRPHEIYLSDNLRGRLILEDDDDSNEAYADTYAGIVDKGVTTSFAELPFRSIFKHKQGETSYDQGEDFSDNHFMLAAGSYSYIAKLEIGAFVDDVGADLLDDRQTSDFSYQVEMKFDPLDIGYCGGHWYMINPVRQSWTNASQAAQTAGGYLASVTDKRENQCLSALFEVNHNSDLYYLGGNDLDNEGDWQWDNGESFNYENWQDGEPNNAENEDVLTWYSSNITNDEGYTWNDRQASLLFPSLIEFETNPEIPEPNAVILVFIGFVLLVLSKSHKRI